MSMIFSQERKLIQRPRIAAACVSPCVLETVLTVAFAVQRASMTLIGSRASIRTNRYGAEEGCT